MARWRRYWTYRDRRCVSCTGEYASAYIPERKGPPYWYPRDPLPCHGSLSDTLWQGPGASLSAWTPLEYHPSLTAPSPGSQSSPRLRSRNCAELLSFQWRRLAALNGSSSRAYKPECCLGRSLSPESFSSSSSSSSSLSSSSSKTGMYCQFMHLSFVKSSPST